MRLPTLRLSAPALITTTLLAALVPALDPAVADQHGTSSAGRLPTAEQAEGICTVTGRQLADAREIELGRTVGLQLMIEADCPAEARGRADILLALDRSTSMGQMGKFAAAKTAVRDFVDGVDFTRHRVGLVVFNDSAYVMQPLTTDPDLLLSALQDVDETEGSTDIARAIQVSDRELASDGRREAVAVLVLLTDGRSGEDAMRSAAEAADKRGTVIFTIGLGPDVAQEALRSVATTPEHYYFAPGPDDLAAIYDQIAATIRLFTVTDVSINDRLSPGAEYVAGSAEPGEPRMEGALTWWRPFLPPTPIHFAYDVRLYREGRAPPSAALWVDYTDGDGTRRRVDIEPAIVEVIVPDTHWAFLPAAYRNQCIPATTWADVVLVLDVSSSMRDENKLQQAVQAARRFVQLMHLPADRAAVVTYDAHAATVQSLTGDRDALEQALAGLTTGSGTRLDRGLEAATLELVARRRIDNRPVIVFLSDGRQVAERHRVPTAAQTARSVGITVFTIALGSDADRELLRSVAGDPDRAYYAPDPSDLYEIYSRVAGIVGCR